MLASLNLHLFSVVHILEFVQTNEAVVELLIVYRKTLRLFKKNFKLSRNCLIGEWIFFPYKLCNYMNNKNSLDVIFVDCCLWLI